MEHAHDFENKLSTLPSKPGVYLMKNEKGKIIYVGKSKCLKNRVSSYFHSYGHSIKTEKLVSNIYDFEIIVTNSEAEALVLENELIKHHNPKYNIKLKDAKTYPYIKMTVHNGYPRLSLSRKRGAKDGKYFGPYTSSLAVNDIIKTIQKNFRIPDCDKNFAFGKRICRPCLSYHLDNCLAPCGGSISPKEYEDTIKQIEYFLRGDYKKAITELEEKMLSASEAMRFEEAAKYRDNIKSLEKLSQKQVVVSTTKNEEDVFGFYESDTISCVTVLIVRGGIVSDKQCIFLSADEIGETEQLCDLILRFYDNLDLIPRNILLSFQIGSERQNELSQTLSDLSGHSVSVNVPERGDKKALTNIAVNNSREAINTRLAVLSANEQLLVNVATLLQLEIVPQRIECYDISNSAASSMYCGMIVMSDGKFSKGDYRSFAIKTIDGQNDYGAMYEAIKRRLLHIGADDDTSMNLYPDLILVDGGVGHVSTIKGLLNELDLDIPIFGMVKDEHHKTRILTDGENEISIAKNQEMFNFFYRLQEEVHRYTFSRMDSNRRKNVKGSSLCEIDGIGEAKARALLKHFGTISRIKKATLEDLTKVSGINKKIAEDIIEHFNQE